ncbi:MAG: hypothetical protein AAB969_01175 [Patescibacteria group bacterium]
MNSKISKKPFVKVEITDDNMSGKMLSLKLEAFCETEPSVLLWEMSFIAAPVRQYRDINGQELETSGSDWVIDFHIIRSNTILENGLFDGVAIIAGRIKNSLEMINGQSQPVYLLSLQSRSIRGEKTFTSAIDLWKTLTNLGIRKS